MKLTRLVALAYSVCIAALTAGVMVLIARYLRNYATGALLAAAGLAGVTAIGAVWYVFLRIVRDRRRLVLAFTVILALLVIVPPVSMWYPGRITYARFGLTVYGAVPVPFFDVTVDRHGILGFRDKTHSLTLDEITPLIGDGVEMLVIGTGWEGRVKVDPEVAALAGVTVHVCRTPDAFDLYNKFIREGKKVVLIAHTTC